ncbi:NAD(P)H-hydrate epimerase [Roseovarius sp. S4756]|uniref:NAD(P)H-hydrate epimerase n=1 Tax=Roseovarius maritimus TaxID=3342637 RepID=UPI003727FA29
MTRALTAAQMRAIEETAILSGAVTGRTLMERAGQGVVEAVLANWPALSAGTHRAVVLCGPGNNGGDGFVVARLLRGRGWDVEVFLYGDPARLPPDAQANYDLWAKENTARALTPCAFRGSAQADIYIDAILGTGLARPVTGDLAAILRYLAGQGGDRPHFEPRLVAVDIPSGLGSDDGRIPGVGPDALAPPCPFCALTVTFHAPKRGHLMARGPDHCGALVVKDIGLPSDPLMS